MIFVMEKMQVDRFEGELAVLIDHKGGRWNIQKDSLGFELHEGDLLEVDISAGAIVSARFLEEETETLRKRAKALMEKLKRKH